MKIFFNCHVNTNERCQSKENGINVNRASKKKKKKKKVSFLNVQNC
jgi:hypothetical protein